MKIQFNTDHSVTGSQAFAEQVEADLQSSLARFAERVTRIEVHLSDVNGGKGGDDDKRCEMDARIAGRQPLAVSATAGTSAQAISGATAKLTHALDHALAKQDGPRHSDSRPAVDDAV